MHQQKRAVVTVSFGTSHLDTLGKTIGAIERDFQESFPGWEVRRAFTSRMIVRKLRDNGIEIDTPAEALARLAEARYDTVVCQPTHIIHGEEYDRLVDACTPFQSCFTHFSIGSPLLETAEDYHAVVKALQKELLPHEEGEALVLMGHGTRHFANSAYGALAYLLEDMGCPNIFLGTVEGYPDLESVLRRVKAATPRKVVLTPFMVVAGDHAVHDMAGESRNSWRSVFTAAGFETETIVRGLGEYESFRAIYRLHVNEAIRRAVSMKD